MSREIYVPIADAFFESSIMQEEVTTRFVMLALIRLGLRPGARGIVDVDLRTFASSIVLPVADVERAIHRLMEPDPLSSSPDENGRRIVPIDPNRPHRNWRLVNWGRYKGIVHRAHDAARKRQERSHYEEDNTDIPDTSTSVQKRPPVSENGATNTNTKTNTKTSTKKKERDGRFAPPSVEEIKGHVSEKGYHFEAETFHAYYESKGWLVGNQPMRNWRAACLTWEKRREKQDFGKATSASAAVDTRPTLSPEERKAVRQKIEKYEGTLPPEQRRTFVP